MGELREARRQRDQDLGRDGERADLVDSVIVPNASTLGDIQTSDDGQLLIVATEFSPGSIMIYSLANPVKPQLISRYTTALTNPGVHTAEVQRVNGTLYAFLSVDPGGGSQARLVIVDLSNPAAPTQVFTAVMGVPFVHDVFVRDGILITALWNQGITIWDIGGAGSGTVSNPIALGNVVTVGGKAHNVWWFHNAVTGEKRYAFVGEEGPGAIGASSSGDIHVVDVSNFAAPREVAFFHVDGAGTHNFSVDESRGILYAAYYNGGVRAIDITGDLSSCDAANKSRGWTLRPRHDGQGARALAWRRTSSLRMGRPVLGRPSLRLRHAQRNLETLPGSVRSRTETGCRSNRNG